MRIDSLQQDQIQLHGMDIGDVDMFIYLVVWFARAEDDIKRRTNKSRHASNTSRPIWNYRLLSLSRTKFHKEREEWAGQDRHEDGAQSWNEGNWIIVGPESLKTEFAWKTVVEALCSLEEFAE